MKILACFLGFLVLKSLKLVIKFESLYSNEQLKKNEFIKEFSERIFIFSNSV